MSRHRKIQLSRSKAIVIAAAGALSVATAASVTAATWTQGPQSNQGLQGTQGTRGPAAGADGPARVADDAAGARRLTATDQLAQPVAGTARQQGSATVAQQAYKLRLTETQDAIARWQAAKKLAATKAAAAAGTAAVQTPAAAQPSQAASATVPAAAGSPRQIAAAMLGSFGWSSSQFACLDPLWEHESGWSVSAYNAGSGAFGIPQALPGSRMASAGPDWQTDAATQITWGLGYIKGTYGSPCGAWAHEQATGWY